MTFPKRPRDRWLEYWAELLSGCEDVESILSVVNCHFRVLTTDGMQILNLLPTNKGDVVMHWWAIRSCLVDKDNAPLAQFQGTQLNHAILEHDPEVVRRRFANGEFLLSGIPWNP